MNRHKFLQLVIDVTLVTLFLVGCGAPAAAFTPVLTTRTATPVPPISTPTAIPTAEPTVMSAPSTTGIVHGVVINESTGQPVTNTRVALGIVEYDKDRNPVRYQISAKEGKIENSAYTDATGAFTIEAPPDNYVLLSPGGSTSDKMARVSGTALIIEVAVGQTVDLGKIPMP